MPIRKKGLSKCHSHLGLCKSTLCPRPQHSSLCLGTSAPLGAAGLRCRCDPRPGRSVTCQWHCWHLAPCSPGLLDGKLSRWAREGSHVLSPVCAAKPSGARFPAWGGFACRLLRAVPWLLQEGQNSSQPGIFTSHEHQAQGFVGLAFKPQDSDSSEHFTKSH